MIKGYAIKVNKKIVIFKDRKVWSGKFMADRTFKHLEVDRVKAIKGIFGRCEIEGNIITIQELGKEQPVTFNLDDLDISSNFKIGTATTITTLTALSELTDDPKRARRKLRKAGIVKPEAGWKWQVVPQEILKIIK